ncbi:MFS transporter [Vineibacter terrae]|uniref:MFS transporter n=1 Tax=Vineibacter terrae TaxID=2586908 RepID=UPI002E34C01F|nr:MFS transporter [Vineibacter terrae]HEX2890891.1 MFS transporter [Vineibacter terrae]
MAEETGSAWRRDARVIGLISAAHFVSHFYILLLPPIFGLVKAEYGVSYTAIGLALTAFNVVSAALQTPAGFLVDRVGPRAILTGGLLLGAGAIAVAAVVPGYWLLVVAFALLGLANTVYHPCDYAILSATIEGKRIGKAFSIHTFAGFLGSGVAPPVILLCAATWGWRSAFLLASAMGIAVALLLMLQGQVLMRPATPASRPGAATATTDSDGWRLLFSAPILRNLMFFALLAMANGGLQNFSVVALGSLHGTPASTANFALSGFLLLSAVGVLVGGIIADRTSRHERVAALCFAATSTMVALVGWVDLNAVLLICTMSIGGLLNGIIQPSRDMMVRAVTPPGAFGKVFGFVSTGFNIGGMVSPLLYGWLMDRGQPHLIFALICGFILLSLFTVITRPAPAAASRPVAAE